MSKIESRTLYSDGLLLLTAAIWGFAFVAQKVGMESCEPFMFNAIRFALGALVLIPFRKKKINYHTHSKELKYSIFTGLALFTAASLQQIGVKFTSAGNAGFITGLYVVFVPIIGIFIKQKTGLSVWISCLFAILGMYFVSVSGSLSLMKGDLFVLASAVIWAIHVQLVGKIGSKLGAIRLAMIQFTICSLLSFLTAMLFETNSLSGIYQATVPILYGGLLSVGIAYTLQIVAQKSAPPSHAAILLSMESMFAVLGGVVVLKESLTLRSGIGFSLMLIAMFLVQIKQFFGSNKTKER